MNKEEQIRQVTEEILVRIKSCFETHKRNIERLNSGGNSGGMGTNEATQAFYRPVDDIVLDLKTLQKSIVKSTKLRKERRNLYDRKVINFIEIMEQIRKKKLTIKIKINETLIRLTKQTLAKIQQCANNLRNFDKEASMLCGKAHDYKPAVEQSMTELAEHSFLWANLPYMESLTNDSVKEIYRAVEYHDKDFKMIQNQIRNLWPDPKVQIVQKQVKIPEIQVISDDHHVLEAHQLLFGFTRSQNITKAIELYKKDANKQKPHPTALCALGQLFEEGKWVPKDISKAIFYFKKSCDLKYPEGQYKMGQYLEKGLINSKQLFSGMYPNRQAEIRGAIELYQKAAKQDHLDAMTDLGYIYQKGVLSENQGSYFVQPYLEHAIKYYKKATKAEFPRAYNNLGTLYLTAQNLSEDAKDANLMKGINCLQKAIDLKDPRAHLNLGKCFENGVGVVQSHDKAKSLYLKGSEFNDIQCKLQYVKSCFGSEFNCDKTLVKMVQITRQVLMEDFNRPEALYYMGLFSEQGIGMQANKESSFYYIEKAARLEYAPAITKLGDFYYSGYFVPKDLEYAKKLYERAAKYDPKSLINLGVLAEKGIGEENDPRRAQQLYEEAATMGHPDALVFLSLLPNIHQPNPSQALVKASAFGSKSAYKMLHSTNTFVPKKKQQVNNYIDSIKTQQNFYIKGSMVKK